MFFSFLGINIFGSGDGVGGYIGNKTKTIKRKKGNLNYSSRLHLTNKYGGLFCNKKSCF